LEGETMARNDIKTETDSGPLAASGRVLSEQGDQRRQLIVERAGELFARFGYRKCTIEDISSACGLTKAALYHYFQSKEAIFSAVLEREGDALLARLREQTEAEPDPVARIMLYSKTRFETIKALANLYDISQAPGPLQPHFEKGLQRLAGEEQMLVKEILDSGVASGLFRPVDTGQMAQVLIAGSKGVMLDYVLGQETETVHKAMDALAYMVCFGLVARPN